MLARFHPIMLLGVMETGVLYLRMDSKLTGKRDEPPPLPHPAAWNKTTFELVYYKISAAAAWLRGAGASGARGREGQHKMKPARVGRQSGEGRVGGQTDGRTVGRTRRLFFFPTGRMS